VIEPHMSACIAITACQGTGCTGYSEQKLTHSTEDEIRHKKWVDNLSEHNQFCSAILHFRSAIKNLILLNSIRTRTNANCKIAMQRAKRGCEVSTWLYC